MMATLGYLMLTLRVAKEGDQWSAICEELGTATYADTVEEALAELRELVGLHLDALKDVGERKQFFEDHGIDVHTVPQVPVQQEYLLGGGVFPEFYPVEYPAGQLQYA
jgi:predicted RNase H-like HicB family nuclease